MAIPGPGSLQLALNNAHSSLPFLVLFVLDSCTAIIVCGEMINLIPLLRRASVWKSSLTLDLHSRTSTSIPLQDTCTMVHHGPTTALYLWGPWVSHVPVSPCEGVGSRSMCTLDRGEQKPVAGPAVGVRMSKSAHPWTWKHMFRAYEHGTWPTTNNAAPMNDPVFQANYALRLLGSPGTCLDHRVWVVTNRQDTDRTPIPRHSMCAIGLPISWGGARLGKMGSLPR